MQNTSSIAKKRKKEIVEEYEKLLEKYDELKMTAKDIYKPENVEIVSKAKKKTIDSIYEAFTGSKKNLTTQLENLSTQLNNHLNSLLNKIIEEAKKFSELQKAVNISKKKLENNYNIEVVAGALENFVNEYNFKKEQLEKEYKIRQEQLEEEIAQKKKEWKREQEEHGYDKDLQRRRDDEIFEEEKEKREKEMATKEKKLEEREQELENLKFQVEQIPEKTEKEVRAREKEVREELNVEFDNKLEQTQKDWEAEKNVMKLRIQNLENYIKRQNALITELKQGEEAANKQAQALAIKVVESGAKNKAWAETVENKQQDQVND